MFSAGSQHAQPSSVAVQSVKSADKALAKSNAASTPTLVAAVQRSANVGLWFVLVAVILGAIAFVFFLRDRKLSRYSIAVRGVSPRYDSQPTLC